MARKVHDMVNELTGKVAIVTGGASGIGRATVERFLEEGARVVIADVERDRGEALAAGCGADALFRHTDVAQPEQVEVLISTAVDKFGGLHVMVNNAGISGTFHKRFLDDDLADFQRVMSVNVLGVMAGTKYAARHMRTTGGGSIINVSSIGGIQAGGGVMTYRASKAAVIHFTKSAAIELAHYDIRVNCLAPGNIPTPLLASSATNLTQEATDQFETAIREQMRADRPLKREGTPADIAEAALYFAGDRSGYVTGTVLPVDGGAVAGKVSQRRRESN
jgi:NAD(P)-dependent dehydrogenase (short-subunit alcohol dehydrogenase family)